MRLLRRAGLDEDAAHRLGSGGEEVPAIVPAVVVHKADDSQVRLVNKGGGVEGVIGCFGGHARGRELPQLVVHERKQVGRGLPVTGRGGVE
jgi:hypothetical protein